jgi:hypothetical protein
MRREVIEYDLRPDSKTQHDPASALEKQAFQ